MLHRVIAANLGNLATHQVFQVVCDWTTAGLSEESVWLDLENPTTVQVVTTSGVRKEAITDWMSSGMLPGDELRVFALQVLRDSKNSLDFAKVHSALGSHPLLAKASGSMTNVIVPVEEVSNVPESTFFDHRLNIVVAPADGVAPQAAHNFVTKKSPEVFSHSAAGLVSLAGLWRGQKESPLERLNQQRVLGPGQNTMISRAFVRYVDASDLVSELVHSVALTDFQLLPNAVDEKGKAFDFLTGNQAQAAVDAIADSFFTEHASMLAFKQPPAFRSGPLKSIGFVDAMKLYFSFVFKWLWTAPGEWAQEKINNAKAVVAKSGQKFLGNESQYEVIVKGVSVRQQDANSELNLSQEILDAARAGLGASHLIPPAAPFQLWENMVTTTCNLADGGSGFDAVSLPAVGTARVLIRDPALLTPDSRSNFFDVPARLPIGMSGARLRSDDPYAAYVVMDQIEEALRNSSELSPVVFNELNQLKLNLHSWVQKNRSFVWQIGLKLGLQLNKARSESRSMLMVTNNLAGDFQLEEAERNARKALWNVIKGGLGIIAIGGLAWLVQAFVVFLMADTWPSTLVADWWIPALLFSLVLLIWNIVGLIAFQGKVGEFFDLEKRINEQKARAAWAAAHLQLVLQELHRLASLYGQYRLWVKVMSPVFHREAGDAGAFQGNTSAIKSLTDLPKSVVVGELSPTPEAREELFSRVRNSFYKRGWIKEVLDGLVEQLGFSSNDIWADTAQSTNSDLVRLASASEDDGTPKLISGLAGESARSLATEGSNFQHWTVRGRGVLSGQESPSGAFIDVLRRGGTTIPVGSVLTDRAGVRGAASLSTANSYFACDSRLDAESDLNQIELISPLESEARSLDLIAIRLELSDLIGSDSFAFTVKSVDSQVVEDSYADRPEIEG